MSSYAHFFSFFSPENGVNILRKNKTYEMGHENICILWFGVFAVPCYAVLHCLCQAMYASFYSTPTLRGSKTDGQQQIIVVNEMLRWRKEVMAERAVQDEEKDGGSEMQDHAKSSCQGINVSL